MSPLRRQNGGQPDGNNIGGLNINRKIQELFMTEKEILREFTECANQNDFDGCVGAVDGGKASQGRNGKREACG